MCGIVGILKLSKNTRPIDSDAINRMLSVIQHRGPDGFGVYRNQEVELGNARLSIIDLSTGDQPISNEDKTIWVVFNGEIFNYIELRSELEQRGHVFETQCDTEVIVHLYEEMGASCVNRFNGQFAIALWDETKHELFLARDRLGVRPVFYSQKNGELVFGSEIKSLFARGGIPVELDAAALREIFTYWSPLSPKSVFKDVFELPPGCTMTVRDGNISINEFWKLDFTEESPAKDFQVY
ncbi:asparagine synthetase B, partial [bacterium]|nr:asparagine synthetase B [bacterium]